MIGHSLSQVGNKAVEGREEGEGGKETVNGNMCMLGIVLLYESSLFEPPPPPPPPPPMVCSLQLCL
jgi:hypothetical protein